MISATDSFIAYLSANLAPIDVAFFRATSQDPNAALLKMDALNVKVLNARQRGSAEHILVSLDLLGTDFRITIDNAKVVRDKLIEQQYTPELDYEASDSGTPLGRMVSWDGRDINFNIVRNEAHYVHLNATFSLFHVR